VPGAKRAPQVPGFFRPELATLRASPPSGDTWLSEVKWDGYRILTSVQGGKATLWSRNGLPWSAKLPKVVAAIEALGLASAQLDGELIAVTDGHPDFNALQQTLSGERSSPLVYVLFDAPYLEGFDLSAATLVDRKRLLEEALRGAPTLLRFSTHMVGHADQAFANAEKHKLEGIMCKRAGSPYRGGRGDDWIKVKRLEADEFAVVGYTDAKGARKGFGSLLLAKPAPGGGWSYVGRVGSGFTDATLRDLSQSVARGGVRTPSIQDGSDAPKDAHWIKPTLVAEVYYRGVGKSGLLRQPSLKTLRPDKSPADLHDGDRKPPAAGGRSRRTT
jgi:bifunctional non-homologous end joining protein LigD